MAQRPPYSMHVFWSDEDEAYIAVCPEFNGMSAFGDSPDVAARELNEAIDGAVEIYEQDGDPLPEPLRGAPHSGQFRIRLPKSLHSRLVIEADREGVSLNTLVATRLAAAEAAEAALRKFSEEMCRRVEMIVESRFLQGR